MEIKPIKTKKDYESALKEIDRLFAAAPGTREGDRLEVLATLVEIYEEKHHRISPPNPIDAIRYYMESRGLSRRDMEPYIGSRARVSEVLNRKRTLTMDMIRNLHKGLGIPAEVLIQPYRIVKEAATASLRSPFHIPRSRLKTNITADDIVGMVRESRERPYKTRRVPRKAK